ncbi:MAG TPA: hypothetical protein VGK87_17085, partial [Anaerolineae bacterium]
ARLRGHDEFVPRVIPANAGIHSNTYHISHLETEPMDARLREHDEFVRMSFPRTRESTATPTISSCVTKNRWKPACAGMTNLCPASFPRKRESTMTPTHVSRLDNEPMDARLRGHDDIRHVRTHIT